jgi:hypothetical protein
MLQIQREIQQTLRRLSFCRALNSITQSIPYLPSELSRYVLHHHLLTSFPPYLPPHRVPRGIARKSVRLKRLLTPTRSLPPASYPLERTRCLTVPLARSINTPHAHASWSNERGATCGVRTWLRNKMQAGTRKLAKKALKPMEPDVP